MPISLSRATFFCKDITASLKLYQDRLGLITVDDKTIAGPGAGALLGLGSCKLRFVLLAAEPNGQPLVALIAISETDIPTMPKPPTGIALGQSATVFQTTHFDRLRSQLENDGVTFLCPPVEYPKPTASPGSPAGLYKEMIFFDPDNNLISVLQIIAN
ncbi:VOC family protein [Rheinheimera salexigens]|uniref:VOC domain-containing protein n=1 Tax=Rheinheimera salexigens TaxID=1628148 RepID=A0A1E7Q6E5_9GAMM|nr:VOC family protein [Rheinheimera salexigens]OEY69707.1 hypothetical protein BI198_09150 [Rheinheimera salexigens]